MSNNPKFISVENELRKLELILTPIVWVDNEFLWPIFEVAGYYKT